MTRQACKLPVRAGTVGDWVQVPDSSHAQGLQGSASPRTGPDGYHGKGRQGSARKNRVVSECTI